MAVPVMLLASITSNMVRASAIKSANQAKMAQFQLERDRLRTEVLKADITANVEIKRIELEAKAADAREERQKEVLIHMIGASDRMHARETEGILEMFRSVRAVAEISMEALANEKAQLSTGFHASEVSDDKHVLYTKRQREISREMADLVELIEGLAGQATQALLNIQPKLGVTRAHAIASELRPAD